MDRVADWELDEPFADLMKVLRNNTSVKDREDVTAALREAITGIRAAHTAALIAIEKMNITAAEHQIAAAHEELDRLGVNPEPF